MHFHASESYTEHQYIFLIGYELEFPEIAKYEVDNDRNDYDIQNKKLNIV